jgi:FKBP-type peptidyl-prolyl cis-trans isomerase
MNFKTLILFVGVAVVAASCNNGVSKKISPKSDLDSVSYLIGFDYGKSLNENKDNFPGGAPNLEAIAAGFADGVTAAESQVAVEDIRTYVNNYFMQAQVKESAKGLEDAEKFLQETAAKAGVISLEEGKLLYEVITEGTGALPTAEDQVEVNYHGTMIDGSVFDSSVDRGEPVTFGVSQVIPGWTKILQMMPVGSKWKVYIHPDLGYGEQGAGGQIKGNSILIFEIDLLSIVK